ncbi:GNAT family N-acetyltransferase [Mycolicibacterium sp. P1-18]|uniref:GNAT family N-acetyltransferase n=1 Tax=Mycolicibacterium sp. P1-18 TaxID=2024615 RepID=UPI0011F30454|nr:GNAT family N-acetyltransferase [Mycolicibacterium sp. P1-18]KAA0091469.1 GNAT family N-acetyltransferase [Mycolicibacterium sp. P1-18]
MNVHLYATPDGFGPVSRWVYRRDPVRFTTELTTLRTTAWPADHLLLAAFDCDGAVGAAVQMRDAVLLVSGLPPTLAKESAAALAPVRADLPAVRGTASTAAAFSQAWAEVTGVTATTSFTETLYRLGELASPDGVAGKPRLADDQDADMLAGWFDAFFVEAFGTTSDPAARRGVFRDVADAGGHVVLWTVDGEPVAMARVHGCLMGMSRIGPVYTPTQHRGRGYGAAVTAQAVRHAWSHGARDVVLFADDANPVSNRIYRRLGFVPVGENVQYAFTA